MNQIYLDTARLLVQVAPFVFADPVFALKGGTAINLFVRDIPRLSVDLDLVYSDYRVPREQALSRINQTIQHAAEALVKRGFQTRTVASADAGETKLLIRRGNIEVKVEVNFNMRGTLKPTYIASLTAKARDTLLLPTSRFRSSRWKICTEASSWPQWIGSILAICSTSCSSSPTKA